MRGGSSYPGAQYLARFTPAIPAKSSQKARPIAHRLMPFVGDCGRVRSSGRSDLMICGGKVINPGQDELAGTVGYPQNGNVSGQYPILSENQPSAKARQDG